MWNGCPEDWGKGHYRDVPVSKYVKRVRERQVRDLQRYLDRDPSFPYYFDTEAADHAVWFFSQLRHFDGEFAGKPFILADWQEWDIIRPLLGWKRLGSGLRRFRKAYLELTRGSGKSMMCSGLGGYLHSGDGEHGAQVYAAATKEDQARIVWEGFAKMIAGNRDLAGEIRTVKNTHINDELGSVFKLLGRDFKKHDGFSVHGGIIDEYHEHKTDAMLEVLSSGTVKRRQPLIAIITTAGFNTDGPCKKESDYSKKILDGILTNEDVFAFVSTVDDPENWESEEEWYKANLNLGVSVYMDTFRSEFNEAKQKPTKRYRFKTKNLNIWCGEAAKWIDILKYERCNGEIDWSQFKGRRCFAGLDLGISRDISALSLAFVDEAPQKDKLTRLYLKNYYWIAEEGMIERHENDGVNYPEWAEAGLIKTTAGSTTRRDIIREDINKIAEEFEIAEIAADQAHAVELMQHLADDGHTVVKHSQSMDAMTFPCTTFEDLISEALLQHGNDPVFKWMVSNAVVIRGSNDRLKVAKDKSTDRVDGVTAACMAIGRLRIAPEPVNSVYTTRGVRAL